MAIHAKAVSARPGVLLAGETRGARAASSGGATLSWGTNNPAQSQNALILSCWVNVTAWGVATQPIWTKDDSPTLSAGWNLQRAGGGDGVQMVINGSGATTTVSCGNTYQNQGWVHVAAVINVSGNTFTTYKNGVQAATGTTTGRSPFTNTASPHIIEMYDGNIGVAEFAIFSWSSLTAAQAATMVANMFNGLRPLAVPLPCLFYAPMYGGGLCEPDLRGFCGYSDVHLNLTPSAGPYNNDASVGDIYKDALRNSLVVPVWAPMSARRRPRYHASIATRAYTPALSYPNLIISDGPVLYWQLNETSGATANDTANYIHLSPFNGTYTNTFTLHQQGPASGLYGVLLDGSTGYVAVSQAAALNITGNLSVEAWCRLTNAPRTGQNTRIVDKSYTSTAAPVYDYSLYAEDTTGHFGFGITIGTTNYTVASAAAPVAGQWYHLVGTYDGSNVRLYQNGILQGTTAASGAIRNDAQPFVAGAHFGGAVSQFFPGTISNVALYNYTLSATQVQTHAKFSYPSVVLGDAPLSYWPLAETSGTTAADVADANTGTYTAGYTINQSGPGPGLGGVLLNGTTGYVACGNAANTNLSRSFSLEAWINTTSTTTMQGIVSHGSQSWYMRVNNGYLDFLKSQVTDVLNGKILVADGHWHHVVATVDASGNVSLYVDGYLDVTVAASGTTYTSSWTLTIGRDTNGAGNAVDFFQGTLSNVAFYNSVLTPTQVLTHANAGGTVPNARVSQQGIAAVTQASPNLRVSQEGIATVVQSTVNLRVSQEGVATVVQYGFARVSQMGVLTVDQGTPNALVSQMGVLTVDQGTPNALVSQMGVLVVRPTYALLPVSAHDGLGVGDHGASVMLMPAAAADGAGLGDASTVNKLVRYSVAAMDSFSLGDRGSETFVPGPVPRPVHGADGIGFADDAAGIDAHHPQTYPVSGGDGFGLGDSGGASVAPYVPRNIPLSAFGGIGFRDGAITSGGESTFVVFAADSFALGDQGSSHNTHIRVAAADGLGLGDRASVRSPNLHVAAADGVGFRDHIRMGVQPANTVGWVEFVGFGDRASATVVRLRSPQARDTIGFSDKATATRLIHAFAHDSLGMTSPGTGARGVRGKGKDTLGLSDLARSNQFLRVSAGDALAFDDLGGTGFIPLGVDPNIAFTDRADARISLAAGGGPAGDAGSGLRDVLYSGLTEDWPVSFAETPNGLVLIANGVDPMIRWDCLGGQASPAGLAPPDTAIALGGFGVGTITGQYTAYVRYLDSSGTPSNLSPISNTIQCGSDGVIESIYTDATSGYLVVICHGHGLDPANPTPIVISGVIGIAGVNIQWLANVIDDAHFYLTGNANPPGTYQAGGIWSAGVTTIAYSGVELPTDPRVVRRQILRNLDGDMSVYYVDIDTTDLASDTFFSESSDEQLSAGEPVPILYRDESPHANRYGVPPSHKLALVAHLGRIFAAGEVTYDRGSCVTAFNTPVVQGVGTQWRRTFAGRLLYVVGAASSYEILAVDEDAQTLTLTEPFGDPVPPIADYAIRPAPGERRLIYYSEPSLPESWPAWNAIGLPEDGDEITGLMVKGSFLYILERRNIYKFSFQEDPSADGWCFLSTRRGCLNHRCQVDAEDDTYFLDDTGIHKFDGQNSEAISQPIQQLFQQGVGIGPLQVDWSADQRLWHAAHDPVRDTIRWFVAMSGWREPRHAICYDYRRERWWLEEYPWPIHSSTIGTIGYRRSIAGSISRRVICLSEGTLDGLERGLAQRGAVGAAGPLALIDPSAGFTPDLAGVPVQIVAGKGAGQARLVVSATPTRLGLDRPWRIIPDATSTYQLGGVPWVWRSGWYAVTPDETENPRDLDLVYEPVRRPTTVDAQLFYDHAHRPRVWSIDTAQDGVTTAAGDPTIQFAINTPRGFSRQRLAGHADPYAYGDQFVSVRLAGVQATEPVQVYSVILRGAQ